MGTVFSAYDIRGRVDDTLTVEYAWTVGKAFSEWLPEEGCVVVVKNNPSNDDIAHGLTEGIRLQGRDVVDGGVGDAQSVVNLINEKNAVGGALISHDDIQNIEMIALFAEQGRVITAEAGLIEINQLVESGNFLPAPEKGKILS